MKENELRIGNYIFDPFDNVVEVASIDKHAIGLTNRCGGTVRSFSPIPLTTEILNKAGFLDRGYGNYQSKYGCFDFGKDLIPYIDTSREGDNEASFDHIKYVHQLQNLHFALMGEELQIDL